MDLRRGAGRRIRGADDGYQSAALADDADGASAGLGIRRVEHQVDVVDHVFEFLRLVVDDSAAPMDFRNDRLLAEAVPMTFAPAARAICTAADPTPPAAPWINTVWPLRMPPASCNAR